MPDRMPRKTGRKMPMSSIRCILLTFVVAALTTSCRKDTLLPQSGGTPYDVVVAGEGSGYVKGCLEADVPGLPQSEPSFNVTDIAEERLKGVLLLSRSIVRVDINPAKHRHPTVKYSWNVYARPQIIVTVNAPSVEALRRSGCMRTVERLLARHEMNAAIARLQQKHNTVAEETVMKMFGCRMKIPADMKTNIKGNDFIWLSDNSTTGMQNICIYASENRDSVMKANIKGETDDMHMTTVPHSTVTTHATEHGRLITIKRGLWQMTGDAMGGPYVSHTLKEPRSGRTVVAEAFVYAPEARKRNRLRQTEAALYTLHFSADTEHPRNNMKQK